MASSADTVPSDNAVISFEVLEEERTGGGSNPSGEPIQFAKAASEPGKAHRRFALQSLCVQAPFTGDNEYRIRQPLR